MLSPWPFALLLSFLCCDDDFPFPLSRRLELDPLERRLDCNLCDGFDRVPLANDERIGL